MPISASLFAASQSNTGASVGAGLFGLIVLALMVYCAYRTAKGGHWVLFVLGFFCGLCWIVGAAMAPKYKAYGGSDSRRL